MSLDGNEIIEDTEGMFMRGMARQMEMNKSGVLVLFSGF